MLAWGYDPASRTLAVHFKSGRVQHYQDVPQEAATAFADHPSKGRAIGEVLGAGGYASVPVLEFESTAADASA